MKKYLVTVKRQQIISMMVDGKNKDDVIAKVDDLMKKCEKNKVSFEKIFNQDTFFKYSVEFIKKNKSQVCNIKICRIVKI